MKSTSKVIMGATLIMVVSLAMVLGLVLVLLAEVYCSLLLRRRQLRRASSNITASHPAAATIHRDASEGSPQHPEHSGIPSLSSFYAQGVLHAPRSFLFPSASGNDKVELEKQRFELRQFYESQTQQPSSSPHHVCPVVSLPASPPFVPLASPKLVHEVPIYCNTSTFTDEVYSGNNNDTETYIYISNPIYDNDGCCSTVRDDTPFETPDTSPSRLETIGGSSGEEDDDFVAQSLTSSSFSPLMTPPLSPMKKLPAEACSVSLRDARSLGTSGSNSNSNNDGISSSSSSSGSPRTSPSW